MIPKTTIKCIIVIKYEYFKKRNTKLTGHIYRFNTQYHARKTQYFANEIEIYLAQTQNKRKDTHSPTYIRF